jgi:hypothetical protein
MSTYPGNKIEILDGNLQPIPAIPENTVLIIDRALSGPTNVVYYVQDLKQASVLYGASSPLIKKASQAINAGARNVALYRYGGQSAQLVNLFGEDTIIETTAQSANADSDLFLYVGVEPNNPTVDCIIIFKGGKVVYSNSLGGAKESSLVTVEGFSKVDNEVYVGSIANPVPFALVKDHYGSLVTVTGVTTSNAISLGGSYVDADVSSYSKVVKVGNTVVTAYTIDGTTLTLTSAVPDGTTVTYTYVLVETNIDFKYVAGSDALTADYRTQYELLDKALDELDLVSAKGILVGDLHGVPNLATGFTPVVLGPSGV